MDTRSIRAYTELFWNAHIDNPKLIWLGFRVFSKELFQGFQGKEAWDLAIVVYVGRLLCGQC